MSIPPKEWRTTRREVTQLRHALELMHGGQLVFYCWQTVAAHSTQSEPITEDTPLTCLWCAAWWEP